MARSYFPFLYQAKPLTLYTQAFSGANLYIIDNKKNTHKISENRAAPEKIYRMIFDIINGFAFVVASTENPSSRAAKYSSSIRWMKMYPPPTLRSRMRSTVWSRNLA